MCTVGPRVVLSQGCGGRVRCRDVHHRASPLQMSAVRLHRQYAEAMQAAGFRVVGATRFATLARTHCPHLFPQGHPGSAGGAGAEASGTASGRSRKRRRGTSDSGAAGPNTRATAASTTGDGGAAVLAAVRIPPTSSASQAAPGPHERHRHSSGTPSVGTGTGTPVAGHVVRLTPGADAHPRACATSAVRLDRGHTAAASDSNALTHPHVGAPVEYSARMDSAVS